MQKTKAWAAILGLLRLGALVFVLFASWTLFVTYRHLPKIDLVRVFAKEEFLTPTFLREFPDREHFAVLEKAGVIKWIARSADVAGGVLLDLTAVTYSAGFEEGLLGLAFDPQFAKNGFIYVFYSLKDPLRSRLSRFQVNGKIAERMSELVLLEIPKPGEWHNGGMLEFGDDGYLYVSIGEGSIPERAEADKTLQSRASLLGAILRLDVSQATTTTPYSIPPDNPFVHEAPPVRREIYAYGFRNAWHFNFDEKSRVLYVNDVGGSYFEEINEVQAGGHHGWPIIEGERCRYSTDHGKCDRSAKVPPVASLAHDGVLVCITGGYANYGTGLAAFKDHYIIAGFEDGLFATPLPFPKDAIIHDLIPLYPNRLVVDGDLDDKTYRIASLAKDSAGTIYTVGYDGRIFKLGEKRAATGFTIFAKLLLQRVGL